MIADLPPADPAIEISVATRGMSKGVAQTDGPQMVARGSLRFGDLQVGSQWKNLGQSTADGEASAFVNLSHKVGSLQLNGGVTYKVLTGRRNGGDTDTIELSGGASRKFGPVTARVNAIYAWDDIGATKRSLYVEGGPSIALGDGWSLSGAVGHRSRQRGVDYTAFNAGIGKSVKFIQLDLRYYDTNRSGAGEQYHNRIVASAKLSF